MRALEIKQDATTVKSPLSLSFEDVKDLKNGLTFSNLLQELGKDDLISKSSKEAGNHKVAHNNILLSLLTQVEPKFKSKEPLELNPEITKVLSPKDLKLLIKEAKQLIKNKIITTEGFKRSEIAKLPKTLKGLTQVAKKIGLDISKITYEEVKRQPTKELLSSLKAKEALPSFSVDTQSVKKEALSSFEMLTSVNRPQKDKLAQLPKVKEEPVKKATQEVKLQTLPIFKPEEQTKLSTQEFVHTKLKPSHADVKKVKKNREDTLKLLLQGEKALQQEGSKMTADFVVATAKVIAPQHKAQSVKSLESLLKGERDEESSAPKHEAVHIAKADSFEVKLNEAKQMTKYLSADVKHAIENYKAPFTRVKVQLHPQKLGEVDLTIVQRGKNLHVSLSSNNAAINALAMNANDLKVQLQNNGIQNASLNFNNNAQGDQNAAGGQPQQQQNRQNAHEEYNFFENEEKNEEVLSSLEIVVPHYA